MTHAALATALVTLLAVPCCSDCGKPGDSGANASLMARTMTTTTVLEAPSAASAAVGVYDVDTEETTRLAGFLGPLVEAKVRGSTLELRADGSYVGRRNGEPGSAGTWSIEDGRLALVQTHEEGEPVESHGDGTFRDGVLTVNTARHGITVKLVFQRR